MSEWLVEAAAGIPLSDERRETLARQLGESRLELFDLLAIDPELDDPTRAALEAVALAELLARAELWLAPRRERLRTLARTAAAGGPLEDVLIEELELDWGSELIAPLLAGRPGSWGPAAAAIAQDPRAALPLLVLEGEDGETWTPAPDLLAAGPDDRRLVAEIDDQGLARLRLNAAPATPTLTAAYRIGNGTGGNAEVEAINALVWAPPAGARTAAPSAVTIVRNPLAVTGGIDPETTAAAKLAIPGAFRDAQPRALSADDYASLAATVAGVRRAAAQLRFTGTRAVVEVAIQPAVGEDPDEELLHEVSGALAPARRIGHLVQVVPPRYRALVVELSVSLEPSAIRAHVARLLARLLSSGWTCRRPTGPVQPVGSGFCHPAVLQPDRRRGARRRRRGRGDPGPVRSAGAGRRHRRARDHARHAGDRAVGQRPHRARARLRDRPPGGRAVTVAPHTSLRRAALLEQLIVALTSAAADSLPIRTRAPDDPTIALLDAWATTGDVLGFYLDRIAAEGYLPSATDAGSILALAGAVGYRPLPGLAAQTYLAYAMAPDPTDTAVRFDQGLLFQSVPGAGQQPQTFESAAPLVAKPSWNLLAPKAGTSPAADATSLVVASTTTNLAPNDMILMQLAPTSADASVAQATAVVAAVNVDYTNGVTDVRLQAPAQVSGGATGAAGAAGSPAVAEPAASGGSGESPAAPTDAGSAIDGLLRSGLAKAAVTLPDSANDLSRSPRTAFAGDSDTVPRILSTLQPAVAGSLYAALDSTVIGAPAVTGAARLQVNAAPFGANAPPQTVFDASGRPAGTRPWPIGDAFTLALTITRADLNALLVHVLDAARGAETGIAVTETPRIPRIDIRCATAQAAGNATIALTSGESRWSARPPGFGEVTLTRNGTTLEFASSASGEAPAVTLSLAWNETTSAFDITLVDPAPPPDNTAQSWDPRATTAFSAAIGDVQLAIGWTPPATADSTVTISLLVPLPLSDRTTLLLDAVHAGIVSGTTIVVTGADPATTVVSSVTSVSTVAAAAYGTTGSVTRLTLADPWIGSDAVLQSDLSAVTVHAQPAALPLNPTPITTPIGGSAIELSTTVAGIEPGRLIVLAGTRADLPSGASAPAAEVAMVQAVSDGAVPGDTVHSTLQLTSALAYSYERRHGLDLRQCRAGPPGSHDHASARQRPARRHAADVHPQRRACARKIRRWWASGFRSDAHHCRRHRLRASRPLRRVDAVAVLSGEH